MTLGLAPRQADLFRGTVAFCEGRVAPGSMYGILHTGSVSGCSRMRCSRTCLRTWAAGRCRR
jgi:hypothetical protein